MRTVSPNAFTINRLGPGRSCFPLAVSCKAYGERLVSLCLCPQKLDQASA